MSVLAFVSRNIFLSHI